MLLKRWRREWMELLFRIMAGGRWMVRLRRWMLCLPWCKKFEGAFRCYLIAGSVGELMRLKLLRLGRMPSCWAGFIFGGWRLQARRGFARWCRIFLEISILRLHSVVTPSANSFVRLHSCAPRTTFANNFQKIPSIWICASRVRREPYWLAPACDAVCPSSLISDRRGRFEREMPRTVLHGDPL